MIDVTDRADVHVRLGPFKLFFGQMLDSCGSFILFAQSIFAYDYEYKSDDISIGLKFDDKKISEIKFEFVKDNQKHFGIIDYSNKEININLNTDIITFDEFKKFFPKPQKNNKLNNGIKQTWLFAHPDNKKFTGPYKRFEGMLLGQQYKILLNHSSHKISLISNSPNTFIYGVEVLDNDKKLFFYEWHVQKGSDKDCSDCWFTSAVSQPFDQGNTI